MDVIIASIRKNWPALLLLKLSQTRTNIVPLGEEMSSTVLETVKSLFRKYRKTITLCFFATVININGIRTLNLRNKISEL